MALLGREFGVFRTGTAACAAVWVAIVMAADRLPAAEGQGHTVARRYVLLVDKSRSTTGERHDRMVESASALIASLPSGSQVGVVAFDSRAAVLSELTPLTDAGRIEMAAKVAAIVPQGGTDMLAGAERALEMLGSEGGAILLVSDGYQTGAGADPQPESVWGARARSVCRRARDAGIVIHTLGLGPDVEADPILKLLASETGGSFHGVREPADLLKQFVNIASLWGRFWLRSDAAEFVTSAPEEVIQILPLAAPNQLFRHHGGHWLPADPVCRFAHAAVRAERYRLPAGKYAFRPNAQRGSHLLRPLEFSVELASEQLPAGRPVEFGLQVVPHSGSGSSPDLADLHITTHLRAGDDGKITRIPMSPVDGGRFAGKLIAPARTGRFEIVVDMEQHGWSYRTGRIPGQFTSPRPLEVAIQPRQRGPAKLTTREPERSASLELIAESSNFGHRLELLVSSLDPRVQVKPGRVTLETATQRVLLQLTHADIELSDLRTTLEFEVATDDLVPAQINGASRSKIDVDWHHRRPQLLLDGLQAERTGSISRGGEVVIPLTLRGHDLHPDERVGIQLGSCRVPPGFSLDLLAHGADGQPAAVAAVVPDTAGAALRIRASREVLPGTYAVELAAGATDSAVPLNGQLRPLSCRWELVVPPVDSRLRIVDGGDSWSVAGPLSDNVKEIELELATLDGGPLPPNATLQVTATAPLRFRELRRQATSSSVNVRYQLTIPAQSPPFAGEFLVSVPEGGVRVPGSARVEVEARPVEVQVLVGEIEIPRYKGRLEDWLGWLRRSPRVPIRVDFQGREVDAAKPAWRLTVKTPDGRKELEAGEDGLFEISPTAEYQVEVASPYEHTRFVSGPREQLKYPVPVRQVVVPLPVWYWAVGGGVLLFVLILAFLVCRRLVLRVNLEPGGLRRGLVRIHMGKMLARPELKLFLTRGRLRRHRRDRTEDSVIVDLDSGQTVELRAGDSIPIHRGDSIQVMIPERGPVQIEVLSGASHPATAMAPGTRTEFDEWDQLVPTSRSDLA